VLGVLVVTHGQLAEELVQAVYRIVGPVGALAAVSIGWDDDVAGASAAIEREARRVDRGRGVLVLTDMFGGTPTNLSLTLFEPGQVEIVTGVNLPMLIKCTNLREELSLHDAAVLVAEEARASIHVAGQVLTGRDDGAPP
jgi:PTS system mannose-specific IIA component